MTDTRFLFRLAGVRRRDIALAVLAGSITLLAALSLTVLSGWLITRAWERPPILDLAVAITAVRALGITRAGFRYIDRLISHRVALAATTRLRPALFDAIVSDPRGTAHTLGRGRALAHLGADVDRFADYIVRCIIPAGIALVVSVIAVLGATLLQPLAGLALGLGFVVTGVVTPALVAAAHRHAQAVATSDALLQALDDQLLHRAEFAVAGLTQPRIDRTINASKANSAAQAQSERPLALVAMLDRLGSGFAIVVLLAVGLHWYSGDPAWLGMLVLLPLAAFESHGPLATCAMHAVDAHRAARRLRKLCADQPHTAQRIPDSLHLTAQSLQLERGTATWNFDAPQGSRHIITGPSGLGKTSFLLTLAGLIPAKSGHCTIGGVPISEIDPAWLRTHVRAHTEDEWIFATTIRENLLVAAPDAQDAMLREVLDFVGLTDFSLDQLLGNGADSLSSGQRRRLLLARALCSDADILLLDEPTEHMSHEDAGYYLHLLQHEPLPGARAERTVIVVTHAEAGGRVN